MSYKHTLLPLISLTLLTNAANNVQPDTTQVRQMIGREKVVTFSKDYLIRKGIDATELASWNNALKKARTYIKTHDVTHNIRLFYALDTANIFVEYAIKKLHENFGQNYQEKNGKYVPTEMENLTPEQVELLTTINAEAKKQRAEVLAVGDAAFPRSFIDAQPTPESWIKTYIKDATNWSKKAEELFPNYQKFLTDYATSKGNWDSFVTLFGDTYGIKTKTEKAYEIKLNQIENCIYALEQKHQNLLKNSSKNPSKKVRSEANTVTQSILSLKEIAQIIRKEFPMIISALDFYKIAKATSMERTVLSAYAEAMEGVLNQIIRETNTLMAAIKK